MSEEKDWGLPLKQAAFLREYLLNGRNATAAYRKAYPTNKNPEVDASKLLRNPKVLAAIKKYEEGVKERFQITEEYIIKGLKSIADFDPMTALERDEKGRLVLKKDIALETLSGADFTIYPEYQTKEDKAEGIIRAKLSLSSGDRKGSFELMGKHIGMWSKDGKDPGSQSNSDARKAVLARVSAYLRKRADGSGAG